MVGCLVSWIVPFWRGPTYVALAADVLLAVVLGGEGLERGLDDTTTQAEHQVEGGLLLVWSVDSLKSHVKYSPI